ncbi:MAG: ABC transporter substrate-binding protein, partial [Candidatus Rokubacteria bacterium]|nr:ABC transporter substrate-binding protein [Candidatus Rokubacteria bacterium]
DLFLSIRGAREFREGKAKEVAGLVAVDQHTVQVTLTEALAPFVSVLAVGHAKIVPRELVKQLGENFGSQPIGTGPFKFVRWDRGREIVLEANPDYLDGAPRLSRIVYRIFPGGNWDSIFEEFQRGNLEDAPPPTQDYRRVIAEEKYIYVRRPMISVRFYGLNTRIKPLHDRRVRQALIHAIDRQALIQEVLLGRFPSCRATPTTLRGRASFWPRQGTRGAAVFHRFPSGPASSTKESSASISTSRDISRPWGFERSFNI